ncbi:MAG TPA: DUF1232 domain-containing protein, partial [Thermoanaerobaculia bacterium]|nr:DUF1232 domain-containing protein [Thermoanaerobaculia bacterium]
MAVTDDDFADDLSETTKAAGPVSADRARRFYDRLRVRIHRYVEGKGSVAERGADFLMLVPDMFILLWRLTNDTRVNAKNKVLLGSGLAYYLFPLDIMPEAILGPIGFIDDLVFGVYILNKLLVDTDPAILREHWSGEEDVLQAIQRVL